MKEKTEATPEQIREYQVLKARNEWIKMNEKKLKEIEASKLRLVRVVLVTQVVIILLTLLNLFV